MRCLLVGMLLGQGMLAACGGERTAANPSPSPPSSTPPPIPLSLGASPPGRPLVERLASGNRRRYEILLEAGQYLDLVVQQRGVDVGVRVFDPEGRPLLWVDSPNGRQGPEEVRLVADAGGRYVFGLEASDGDGLYEVRVDALRAASRADRTRGAAAAAYSRARAAQREGQTPAAAAGYREAAALWQRTNDAADEAWSLFWFGKLSVYTSDPVHRRDGVLALDRARGLFRRLGNRSQEGYCLYFGGLGSARNGEIAAAFHGYEEALSIWRELRVPFEEATCLNNLALLRVRQGRLQAAVDLYFQAIAIFQQLSEGSSEAATRTNLGLLYAQLGEERLAVDQYRKSLAALAGQTQPASVTRRAIALNKLGDLLLRMEGPASAMPKLREALELRRLQRDTFGEAVTLNSMGLAQVEANQPREALADFSSAVEIFRRTNDRPAQAVAVNNLGIAYERLGYLRRARQTFEAGLELDPHGDAEMAAIFGLARVARAEDRLDEAEQRMERLLALVEDFRSQLWRPDLRATYQAEHQEQYTFLVDLLAERHRREPGNGFDARAFAVSERARARSLLDLLLAARAHPDGEELRRLDELSRQINTRHLDLLASPHGIASGELETELTGLLESWRQTNAAVRGPPRVVPAVVTLEATRHLLDDDVLLLEYFLGEARSYLWAVTSSGSRFVATLPKRADVEAAARQLHSALTESRMQTGEAAARLAAVRLSRMVLAPVADLLDRPRVAVVAYGALQAVPFAALPLPNDGSRLLVADHEIVSLPSASVLGALRSKLAGRQPAPELLAVVADPVLQPGDPRLQGMTAVAAVAGNNPSLPRLRYAGLEAADILEIAGSDRAFAASGLAASRALVQSGKLRRYRILHFATHGLFDEVHPELSSLALAAFDSAGRPIDGQLRAYEVSGLDLRADLVVLSACRTALGHEVGGEGMVGLTQGFLHGGAARLLVSLWDVDDRSTGELMKRFYAALLHDGVSPAQALRRAQLSLSSEARWKAPYYWASFVLQGEWQPAPTVFRQISNSSPH